MIKTVKYRFPGLWNSEYPLAVNQLIDNIRAIPCRVIVLANTYFNND